MLIKKMLMLFIHPFIFFNQTIHNNLLIGKGGTLRKLNKMKVGHNVRFGYDTRIQFFDNSMKDVSLMIGNNSYFGNRCSLLVGGKIRIGGDVLVASDVCIVSENHSIDVSDSTSYAKQKLNYSEITIGDGCWIGEKVVICGGVNVGKRCVIGAGAIVTKDIEDYCIAVGNPAHVIKKYNFETARWEKV
ncbi:MAG: acyltransferase [Ruminococcus flavefaciens]|nr:acyltransferase [Ruminococcus flavefaciens]